MKHLIFSFLLLLAGSCLLAQDATLTVDRLTGDSTITTGFDTLHAPAADTSAIPDRVVGVRTTHKGVSTYWLFFYFPVSDIEANNVTIGSSNYAYFQKDNDEYVRIPYKGRSATYKGTEEAGFFIDVTNFLSRLRSATIKTIRFETSHLYHEIVLPPNNQDDIAKLISQLEQ